MLNSAVQLTFPCPACGGFVTLRTFRAAGPCPACGTQLEVTLHVQAVTDYPNDDGVHGNSGKKFDERRFRPVAQPPQ